MQEQTYQLIVDELSAKIGKQSVEIAELRTIAMIKNEELEKSEKMLKEMQAIIEHNEELKSLFEETKNKFEEENA